MHIYNVRGIVTLIQYKADMLKNFHFKAMLFYSMAQRK